VYVMLQVVLQATAWLVKVSGRVCHIYSVCVCVQCVYMSTAVCVCVCVCVYNVLICLQPYVCVYSA
jgi:hypothetical protein